MKINLGVFYGGKSVEHEVSIISALQAMINIDREKYNVIPVYITKDDEWYTGEELFDVNLYRDLKNLKKTADRVYMKLDKIDTSLFRHKNNKKREKIDMAFPILHGGYGEDGRIQSFFEMIDIPYVGSDYVSSAIGMDKELMKKILKADGIRQVEYKSFMFKEFVKKEDEVIKELEDEVKYPVIVKPSNLGSSIGIAKASNREELIDVIFEAAKYSEKIIVERCIENLKEINISVLGDSEEQRLSVCEQPLTDNEILSYTDKYVGERKTKGSKGMASLSRKIPADISEEIKGEIEDLAIKIFNSIGCSGVIRIDFMIEDNEKVYVNEVNTIPGSLSFYLWKHDGIKYKKLINDMLKLAIKKYMKKEKLTYVYKENVLALGGGIKGLKGSKGAKGGKF